MVYRDLSRSILYKSSNMVQRLSHYGGRVSHSPFPLGDPRHPERYLPRAILVSCDGRADLLLDDPKMPLNLLVFASQVQITTLTCVVDIFGWDVPAQDKKALYQIYLPYLAFGTSSTFHTQTDGRDL